MLAWREGRYRQGTESSAVVCIQGDNFVANGFHGDMKPIIKQKQFIKIEK